MMVSVVLIARADQSSRIYVENAVDKPCGYSYEWCSRWPFMGWSLFDQVFVIIIEPCLFTFPIAIKFQFHTAAMRARCP